MNLSMNMWRAWLMWQKQILSYNRWQKFGTAQSSKFRKLFVKLFVTNNFPIGLRPQLEINLINQFLPCRHLHLLLRHLQLQLRRVPRGFLRHQLRRPHPRHRHHVPHHVVIALEVCFNEDIKVGIVNCLECNKIQKVFSPQYNVDPNDTTLTFMNQEKLIKMRVFTQIRLFLFIEKNFLVSCLYLTHNTC